MFVTYKVGTVTRSKLARPEVAFEASVAINRSGA